MKIQRYACVQCLNNAKIIIANIYYWIVSFLMCYSTHHTYLTYLTSHSNSMNQVLLPSLHEVESSIGKLNNLTEVIELYLGWSMQILEPQCVGSNLAPTLVSSVTEQITQSLQFLPLPNSQIQYINKCKVLRIVADTQSLINYLWCYSPWCNTCCLCTM